MLKLSEYTLNTIEKVRQHELEYCDMHNDSPEWDKYNSEKERLAILLYNALALDL